MANSLKLEDILPRLRKGEKFIDAEGFTIEYSTEGYICRLRTDKPNKGNLIFTAIKDSLYQSLSAKNNWNWALEQLKKGNKIRRLDWTQDPNYFWCIDQGNIMGNKGIPAEVYISDLEASDWILYE